VPSRHHSDSESAPLKDIKSAKNFVGTPKPRSPKNQLFTTGLQAISAAPPAFTFSRLLRIIHKFNARYTVAQLLKLTWLRHRCVSVVATSQSSIRDIRQLIIIIIITKIFTVA